MFEALGDVFNGTDSLGSSSKPNLSSLFKLGDVGVLFEPQVRNTMWQDAAGVTPVSTYGQGALFFGDRSQGMALGPELGFADGTLQVSDIAVQSANLTVTDLGDRLRLTRTAAAGVTAQAFLQSAVVVANKMYETEFTILGTGASNNAYTSISNGGVTTFMGTSYTTGVTVRRSKSVATAAGTGRLRVVMSVSRLANPASSIEGDWIEIAKRFTVRELKGHHAAQASAASALIYGRHPVGGTRNLLTWTEDFSNAVWTKTNATISANAIAAPNGTLTADTITGTGAGFVAVDSGPSLAAGSFASYYVKAGTETKCEIWPSGGASQARFDLTAMTAVATGGSNAAITAGDDGWVRISVQVSNPGNRLILGHGGPTVTTSLHVWGAQAGPTLSAYQKVTTAYDVTEAGKADCYYALHDGADNSLATAAFAWGSDKLTIIAAVRKNSDAAAGIIAEFGTQNTNFGGWYLANDPPVSYSYSGRGSRIAVPSDSTNLSGFPAPDTAVITVQHDLNSGQTARIRRNGGAWSYSASTTFGGGNFGTYGLNIGRRNNSSLPFNGPNYSLFAINRILSADELALAERLMAAKYGGML